MSDKRNIGSIKSFLSEIRKVEGIGDWSINQDGGTIPPEIFFTIRVYTDDAIFEVCKLFSSLRKNLPAVSSCILTIRS